MGGGYRTARSKPIIDIFSRARALVEAGAIHKPQWLDGMFVYRPRVPPRKNRDDIPELEYPEDQIREWYDIRFTENPAILSDMTRGYSNMVNTNPRERFVQHCLRAMKNEGISAEEAFERQTKDAVERMKVRNFEHNIFKKQALVRGFSQNRWNPKTLAQEAKMNHIVSTVKLAQLNSMDKLQETFDKMGAERQPVVSELKKTYLSMNDEERRQLAELMQPQVNEMLQTILGPIEQFERDFAQAEQLDDAATWKTGQAKKLHVFVPGDRYEDWKTRRDHKGVLDFEDQVPPLQTQNTNQTDIVNAYTRSVVHKWAKLEDSLRQVLETRIAEMAEAEDYDEDEMQAYIEVTQEIRYRDYGRLTSDLMNTKFMRTQTEYSKDDPNTFHHKDGMSRFEEEVNHANDPARRRFPLRPSRYNDPTQTIHWTRK